MTFKDMFEWDEFYYSPHTKQILSTPFFNMANNDTPSVTEFEVNFERTVREQFLTDIVIFGITVTKKDYISDIVNFRKAMRNINSAGGLEHK